MSKAAKEHREGELCRFNNKIDRCTKDKANAPLGVCSLNYNGEIVTICPVRFRENWIIAKDAANFFFGGQDNCTVVKEVRLRERTGKAAGNIDLVIAHHTLEGKVNDFGAVEIQSVYVSGNIRNPFEYYMESPENRATMDWTDRPHYPRPDFLSSSRKRLIPQLLYKGQILRSWSKKLAVVVDKPFFSTLPDMERCSEEQADVCWLVYSLEEAPKSKYELVLAEKVYTTWDTVFATVTNPDIGDVEDFLAILENKLSPVAAGLAGQVEMPVYDWSGL